MDRKLLIDEGKTALGIELGSTRIKAVLVDERERLWLWGAMSGKISMWTVYGLIPLRKCGRGCRAVIRICSPM